MIAILKSKKILAALLISFILISIMDLIIPARTFFPDEDRFIGEAISIAETGEFWVFDMYRAWEMPLVGVIYALFYKLFGEGAAFIRSVRVFQALLHVLTAIGAASIANSLFKNKFTTVLVMFSTIIYPSLLAYQASLLSENIFVFFLIWGFAFLYKWTGNSRMPIYSTIAFVLSLYAKAVLTVTTPALIALRSLAASEKRAVRAKYVAFSCVIFVICLLPWWVRNFNIFGEFVPFTTSASWNLYLGNNPVNLNAGVDWTVDVDTGRVGEIMALDELSTSKAFSEGAKKYISENKYAFIRNALLKFKRFWNFQSNYTGGMYSASFKLYNLALLLSWGVACPLGVASVFVNRKRWVELLPIYALVIYFTFMHIVVIASLRYRLPIEPFFIILGADCLYRIIRRVRPDIVEAED